ncbi:unnamed protein product [Bursaphelenchus xylophilus]|nr:unnamed protein product [Bursaphelenchus xylophilus]CAG9085863.1 unnamed protein product [Bursaphelenchus xylophilus]
MRMKLKHPEECDRYGIYTPLYFCAGETEISTEAGDSGAPVIVESSVPTQVGVVIGQQQLDQNNLSNGNLNPTVILKIPLFCDWIRNVTKGVRCI